jgi:hypothetical protein
MNESALNYEYLIRRAFQCGRYGVPGANADIYRALEMSFVLNRDNNDIDQSEKLLFDYAFNCGEVATYIITAIEKFANDFEENLTAVQIEEVEDLISLLNNSRIEQIEQVIVRAQELMIAYGRYPA